MRYLVQVGQRVLRDVEEGGEVGGRDALGAEQEDVEPVLERLFAADLELSCGARPWRVQNFNVAVVLEGLIPQFSQEVPGFLELGDDALALAELFLGLLGLGLVLRLLLAVLLHLLQLLGHRSRRLLYCQASSTH